MRSKFGLTENPVEGPMCTEYGNRKMNYTKLIGYYGGLSKAAKELKLSRQTVFSWKQRRRIPERWQVRIEAATDGKLKASEGARREAAEFAAVASRIKLGSVSTLG